MKKIRVDAELVRLLEIKGVKWEGDGSLVVFTEGDGEAVCQVERKVTKAGGAWFQFTVDGRQLGGGDDAE